MAAESSDRHQLELVELERARIGHEIHDALLPLVFAASASLRGLLDQEDPGERDAVGDADRKSRLIQIADWLDEALQVGRKLLVEVYPPELEGRDWQTAVEETLSRILDSDCELDWQVDADINGQSESVLSAAYRIVIEAVRNAVRHGRANRIIVRTERDAGTWSLIVEDNGRGFDPSEIPADRFGVRTMLGRAQLVGGSCRVNSATDQPTTVRFDWPE